MGKIAEDEKVDFVILWVDGNDPEWQASKAKYTADKGRDASANRYREWENLKYWFRGVEKFAPWVNNVYFVTCGHYPEWLNLSIRSCVLSGMRILSQRNVCRRSVPVRST